MKKVLMRYALSAFILSTVVSAQTADKISAAFIIGRTLNESGMDAAVTKFKELNAEKNKYSISHPDFLTLGRNLRIEGKVKEAITVFHITTELFPDSDQAYLELARCYRLLGLGGKDLENTNRAFQIRDTNLLKAFFSENKDSILKLSLIHI